jgi:cytochrome oxidase Cu insertion factor (SCO1/SenC/PrrC family)
MRRTARLLPILMAAVCLPGFPRGVLEPPVQLSGTMIEHPGPAPDFTLTDQDGRPFHMADSRGKVVVMSFLYTHCTDLCPYVAVKMKSARAELGTDADNAVFVAVTTDPERDTQKVLDAYTRSVGLAGSWHFLTGTLPEVKAVWFSYGVGVDIQKTPSKDDGGSEGNATDPEPIQGLSADEVNRARSVADAFGGGYEVAHSTPIWIIDRQGRIRATMDADALPSEIAGNVRALMSR